MRLFLQRLNHIYSARKKTKNFLTNRIFTMYLSNFRA
uniref:Uncharacterized protein n=1 Tax=Arundo donax TaxID=35708 RepID=A0A0A9BMY9_ARUDO